MAFIEDLRRFALSLQQRVVLRIFSPAKRGARTDERTWELGLVETAAYHRIQTRECAEADIVNDRVWTDLEMMRIHAKFDGSVTPLGAQCLYALLRRYERNPVRLAENAKAHQTFKIQPEAAARLRAALADLNRQDAGELVDFLLGPPPVIPPRYPLFYLLSVLTVVCPFGLIVSGWFVLAAVGLGGLNILLYYLYGHRVTRYAGALKSLAVMLGRVPAICDALANVDLPEAAELRAKAEVAKVIQKKVSLAFLRNYKSDDLIAVLTDYLNLVCLFELCAYCRALHSIQNEWRELAGIFHVIARLDAFQGLALTLAAFPSVCVPEFQNGGGFSMTDIYHPLVDHPVPNSIESEGMSLLLSGTNMAGKTTFIKTLGLNVVLAQTLGLCLASMAVLPPARVRTLIERQDTLTSGQSYFYFEACELLRMAREAEQSDCKFWFVLDELFRGTNAVERVAAGGAVLNHLNSLGFVLASTHDHELTFLLRQEFESYHFSEVIDGKEARFDYRLRKGACTTRNAIKLLALAGYPKSVTEMAESIASSHRLSRSNNEGFA